MTNYEKYVKVFKESFELPGDVNVEEVKYQGITEWDSVGHMELIAEIEDEFNIEMDTDDIIDFDSFKKGIEILKKYEVSIEK